jgi:4-amino-4-deoxy-L-arabinose transferase-like glycosyltransferase
MEPVQDRRLADAPPHDVASERTATAFLLALGMYFLVQVAIRVVQKGALALDEAEQVFDSQQLLLGYGSQPPLYEWLQWLVFRISGVNHVGLSVLKNALMFALYASVFQLARLLLGTLAAAAIASSLVLIVPLGWEAQIDRSHSLLASALAAAALWVYFTLLRTPGRLRRALLGVLLGLGMQSKYNFLIFILGLTAASLLVREHRRPIWTRDMWITVAVATLCLLPHAIWFSGQVDIATGDTLHKMNDIDPRAGYAATVASGFKHLFLSIASFVTPLWIVLGFAYWGQRQRLARAADPGARFFLALYASGLSCLVALVLSGHLAHIKSRWLQPLLFSAPLACFALFPPKSPAVYRRLLLTAAVVGLLMIVALAVRPQVQSAMGNGARFLQPFPELASELVRRFPDVKVVAVQDRYVGGNVRMQLPHMRVLLLEQLCGRAPPVQGPVLVLARTAIGGNIEERLNRCPGVLIRQRGHVSVRSQSWPNETLQIDYAVVAVSPGTS